MAGISTLVAGMIVSIFEGADMNVQPCTRGILRPSGELQVECRMNLFCGNYKEPADKDIVNVLLWEYKHLPSFLPFVLEKNSPFFLLYG